MIISGQLYIFPSAIVSYYKYYVLEQADKSFQQIFPAE